jgi:hypothetical protein
MYSVSAEGKNSVIISKFLNITVLETVRTFEVTC